MKALSNRAAIAVLAIVIGVVLFWNNCTLIVHEYEQVVLTEFGQPVGDARVEPGLYFVLPWYQRHVFSRRLMRWDGERAQIPTRDKRFIWVDATARWRIVDPLKFLQAVGNVRGAQTRLDDVIDSKVREIISKNDLIEAVRSSKKLIGLALSATRTTDSQVNIGRVVLQKEIVASGQAMAAKYGIALKDVRIKRINYIGVVQKNIYNRMVAERRKVAEQYRSEGKGRAAEILGRMERQLKKIRSGAYRKSREIQGSADAEATRIYADAYSQDAEFYAFLQSLEMWDKGLGAKRKKGTKTTLIMSTNAAFFRYLKHPQKQKTK